MLYVVMAHWPLAAAILTTCFSNIIDRVDRRRRAYGEAVGSRPSDRHPASLERFMAKGQKRSNREVKKPKKTAAERAKASATPAMGMLGKGAGAGQKRR